MSKLHLLIVGFNSVPKVRRLRRKLLVCNASHTWLFLATIPSNLIHYWLGPNSEGFWNLWGYLVLPRRPVPVHARPWWQWCHFPCHLTLRFCILIFKDNLSSLYRAFNCQARSLGCLVVKLAVPVKPKGEEIFTRTISSTPIRASQACFRASYVVKRHKSDGVRRLVAHPHLPLYIRSTVFRPQIALTMFQHPVFSGGQDGAVSIWEWAHATQVSTVRFFSFSSFSLCLTKTMS